MLNVTGQMILQNEKEPEEPSQVLKKYEVFFNVVETKQDNLTSICNEKVEKNQSLKKTNVVGKFPHSGL